MSCEMMFDDPSAARVGGPDLLEHDLNKYFPELLKFESSGQLAASTFCSAIRFDAERILNAVVAEDLSEPPASAGGQHSELPNCPAALAAGSDIKALAWNIERGIQFDGIV